MTNPTEFRTYTALNTDRKSASILKSTEELSQHFFPLKPLNVFIPPCCLCSYSFIKRILLWWDSDWRTCCVSDRDDFASLSLLALTFLLPLNVTRIARCSCTTSFFVFTPMLHMWNSKKLNSNRLIIKYHCKSRNAKTTFLSFFSVRMYYENKQLVIMRNGAFLNLTFYPSQQESRSEPTLRCRYQTANPPMATMADELKRPLLKF